MSLPKMEYGTEHRKYFFLWVFEKKEGKGIE